MSGWIKFWKDTDDDPRLAQAASLLRERYLVAKRTRGGGEDLSISDELRFMRNALRGCLATLWCYADTHIGRDDILPISSQTLDALVGIEGFCDVMPVDWIEKLDDGTIRLPGYAEKNELIAKEKRASNAKARQAAWRARSNAKSNASHDGSVTRDERVSKCVRPRPTDLDLKKKEEEREARAPRSPTATRLPADFALTPERRAIAEAEKADPEREFASFTDHWKAASGAKARKHDWDATWRNWCRRAADFKPRGPPGGVNGSVPERTWRPSPDEDEHADH
jgi:hypothetical protein